MIYFFVRIYVYFFQFGKLSQYPSLEIHTASAHRGKLRGIQITFPGLSYIFICGPLDFFCLISSFVGRLVYVFCLISSYIFILFLSYFYVYVHETKIPCVILFKVWGFSDAVSFQNKSQISSFQISRLLDFQISYTFNLREIFKNEDK